MKFCCVSQKQFVLFKLSVECAKQTIRQNRLGPNTQKRVTFSDQGKVKVPQTKQLLHERKTQNQVYTVIPLWPPHLGREERL